MKQVFGPVPSRRLGQSLGIDPVPMKTCNFNCVYCQIGRTRPYRTERRHNFKVEDILDQVRDVLSAHHTGEIDWITFVGSGETTLHAGIGELVRGVKEMTDIPVAVITNGSLFYMAEVRQELAAADAVLTKLDAGSPALYRRINRPYQSLVFDQFFSGLVAFRKLYQHQLWVDVMLMKDVNDSERALEDIAALLSKIQPDEVHISLPSRPPAEPWVRPADKEGIERAKKILSANASVLSPREGKFDFGCEENLVDGVVGIINRHPMTETELINALAGWDATAVESTIEALKNSGRVQIVTRQGVRFWCPAEAYYGSS